MVTSSLSARDRISLPVLMISGSSLASTVVGLDRGGDAAIASVANTESMGGSGTLVGGDGVGGTYANQNDA